MIQLKPGARILGLTSEILFGIIVVESVYRDNGISNCVVTHVTDGAHSVGSHHYKGCAFDLRTHNIPDTDTRARIHGQLKEALGEDFDVLWESRNTPNEHFHIEFDPKRAY